MSAIVNWSGEFFIYDRSPSTGWRLLWLCRRRRAGPGSLGCGAARLCQEAAAAPARRGEAATAAAAAHHAHQPADRRPELRQFRRSALGAAPPRAHYVHLPRHQGGHPQFDGAHGGCSRGRCTSTPGHRVDQFPSRTAHRVPVLGVDQATQRREASLTLPPKTFRRPLAMPSCVQLKPLRIPSLCPSLLAIAGGVAGLSLMAAAPAQALSPTAIAPIFSKSVGGADQPGGVSGSRFPSGTTPYSVGYFFDVTGSGYSANAVGLSAQLNVPWTQPYTVHLFSWEYDPAQAANPDTAGYTFTSLAARRFNPGDPNLITTTGPVLGDVEFYWLGLGANVPLQDTSDAVDPDGLRGYAVATRGLFNEPDGNFIESGGFVTFGSRATYLGDGFNAASSNFLYPFPVFEAGVNGYWNGNVSVVPGPLPVMGVAAAFGWSRRLKKKTKNQL